MDNVTHALAGVLLADLTLVALRRRVAEPLAPALTRATVWLGIIAAELPDADLLYSGPLLGIGKLGYLLHHRGHTHTLLVSALLAMVCWGGVQLLSREARRPEVRWWLLGLALTGAFSHLLLDYTNSYGVHPFWPLNNTWYYGDAVFIVEPWLWVLVIPPLYFGGRRRLGRVALALALLAILAAAWTLSLVGGAVALALTVTAILWTLLNARVRNRTRLTLALSAWLTVELICVAATAEAKVVLMAASAPSTLVDLVMSPQPGNPLCVTAQLVERADTLYRITSATVATMPMLVPAESCAGGAMALAQMRERLGNEDHGFRPSARTSSVSVVWQDEWSRPLAELQMLNQAQCTIASALEFIRIPIWTRVAGDSIRMADYRFGFGAGGFAELVVPDTDDSCPPFVPGWRKPRADLLEG